MTQSFTFNISSAKKKSKVVGVGTQLREVIRQSTGNQGQCGCHACLRPGPSIDKFPEIQSSLYPWYREEETLTGGDFPYKCTIPSQQGYVSRFSVILLCLFFFKSSAHKILCPRGYFVVAYSRPHPMEVPQFGMRSFTEAHPDFFKFLSVWRVDWPHMRDAL